MKEHFPRIAAKTHLFEIANSQGGFFTSVQAAQAGIRPTNFTYHVKAGNWVREGHGIYRLANYPLSSQIQYIPIWLWTFDKKGVPHGAFSHETALSMWGLTDVMPSKIHISVVRNFRRSSHPPQEAVLHKVERILVTKNGVVDVVFPLQALVQVFEAGSLTKDMIAQGFNQAVNRGIIRQPDFEKVPMETEARAFFDGLRHQRSA